MDEVFELYEEIFLLEKDLMNELLPNTYILYNSGINMDKAYWEDKIAENILVNQHKDAEEYDSDYYGEALHEIYNEDFAIDDLFVKTE